MYRLPGIVRDMEKPRSVQIDSIDFTTATHRLLALFAALLLLLHVEIAAIPCPLALQLCPRNLPTESSFSGCPFHDRGPYCSPMASASGAVYGVYLMS